MRNILLWCLFFEWTLLPFYGCNENGNRVVDDEDEKPIPVEEEAYAFPGAEGFGRKVTGGEGVKCYLLPIWKIQAREVYGQPSSLRVAGMLYLTYRVLSNLSLH